MVGRLRERQYQLTAQKHNEACLKYDYYQQTARYFERECRIAKHYDSWNFKGIDPTGEVGKAKKAERLLTRRNKLRSLLREEEQIYQRELEESTKRKKPPIESLETLKDKLKEKRAEESLYLPKTCRRYQSYFVCPTESRANWNTLKDTNLQRSRACRDSTNFIQRNERDTFRRDSKMSSDENKSSKGQDHVDTEQSMSRCTSSQYVEEMKLPNPKFLARYARRSLENTNVRNEDTEGYVPSRRLNRSSSSLDSTDGKYTSRDDEVIVHGDNKENHSSPSSGHSPRKDSEGSEPGTYQEASPRNSNHQEMDEVDRKNVKDAVDKKNLKTKDNREFESEKSLPWLRMIPTDKNLSKQMFLYLTHRELKCKIEDLAKRESHACMKHCWDEALRLRDMRNRLELIREKRLYNTENLELDEDTRKIGLVNIGKREEELSEREFACMDSTMYSEDAKAMWKKWVHEDENSVIKDARVQRETLMSSLEKEWQNLAIRDKERISQSFQNVMSGSSLQDEHKLSAAITAARMKTL